MDEKKEKGKTINFWTWFEKNYGSLYKRIIDEEEEKKRNDVYIYQILKYPPNSNPPRHNIEQLKLIFNQEIMGY